MIQHLLDQAFYGDRRAVEHLLRYRICPGCGVHRLRPGIYYPGTPYINWICVSCGWTWPPTSTLNHVPQDLLATRSSLLAHGARVRELVRASVLAGAHVEGGNYTVQVNHFDAPKFTREAVQRALSARVFEQLLAAMPRQPQVHVKVFQTEAEPPTYRALDVQAYYQEPERNDD